MTTEQSSYDWAIDKMLGICSSVMCAEQSFGWRKKESPSNSNKLHEEVEGSLAVGLSGVHGSQWEDCCPFGCLMALRGVLLEVLDQLVHLHSKLMPHLHDRILQTRLHARSNTEDALATH